MSATPRSDLLQKVEDYLMEDDALMDEFEAFAAKHCDKFTNDEENKLEYTEIYNEFTDLFNKRVEGFIRKAGSTPEEFQAQLANSGKDSFVLELILSITSFPSFKKLMLDAKKS